MDDSPTPVRTIRDAVPTLRHARMLFDMVVDALGERGLVETAGGGRRRTLLRRDGDRVVPWPLLRLGIGDRLSTIVPITPGLSAEPPTRPGKAPKLRGLGRGEVVVHDGPDTITVTYGDDGRWAETARSESPDALRGVVATVAKGRARPVELVAEFVAALDPGRHGPGRVVVPVPVPHVPSVWTRGLHALREALFDDRVPRDAEWVVADGFAGTAIAWGATRDEALGRWREEVQRVRPRPPVRKAPPQPPPPGALTITAPAADVPQPEPTPENTPAVVIPVAPPPEGPWVRLLGRFGKTRHALRLDDRRGFTLVGDRVVDLVETRDLAERLDAVPLPDAPMREGRAEPLTSRLVTYRVVDEDARVPVTPSFAEAQYAPAFKARALDGDRLRRRAVRQCRI